MSALIQRRASAPKSVTLLVTAAVVCGVLTACGGSDDESRAYFGAIAVNSTTRAAGMTANYGSQPEANNAAVNQCGVGCSVVLQFGNGQCGAVARGSNFAMGWASAASRDGAESTALLQCRNANGTACVVYLSMCNG